MSNLNKAFEVFANNITATRQEVLALFRNELGLGKNTASTYYYNCKKKFQEDDKKEAPIVEIKPTVVVRSEPYDYGDVVPDFIKRSYEKMGWNVNA